MGLSQGLEQGGKEKFDELGGVRHFVASGVSVVVVLLLLADEIFHGEVGEGGFPLAEDEGLPKSGHAAIAISKGVDESQLIVEDTSGDEGMGVGGFEPGKEVLPTRLQSNVVYSLELDVRSNELSTAESQRRGSSGLVSLIDTASKESGKITAAGTPPIQTRIFFAPSVANTDV